MHHEARIQTVPFFMSPKLKPNSEVYKKNVQVQSWLQGTWFPKEKRWASAYREHKIDIKINTNNGVEAQNKVFKYNYLSKGTDKTLVEWSCKGYRRIFLPGPVQTLYHRIRNE